MGGTYRDPGLFGVHSLVGQRVQTSLHVGGGGGGGYFYCHLQDEIIDFNFICLAIDERFLFVCLESQSIIAMVVIFFFIKFL